MNKHSNKSIDVSVIILSYNTQSLTCQTINSIYNSTKLEESNFEIIIFDNNSIDNSVEEIKKLQKLHSNLKLIENKDNIGFSRGNNLASKSASGRYILFLNSDIIVHDMAIDKLLNFAKKQSSDFFVGGKLLNSDGSPQPSCGPFYSLPVVFAALFLRGDYWGLTRYSPIVNRRVDWVSGACLLTNNTTFNKLKGFDEKIFMYMEEIDLLFRAKKAGILTYFVHSAIFTHLGSASSGGKSYPIIQVFRGFSYFYNKHHGPLSKFMLKNMLQFKAYLVIFIAGILKKPELAKTYESAKNNIKLD